MSDVSRNDCVVALRMLDPEADLSMVERWLQSPHVVRWWGPPERLASRVTERSRTTDAVITADGRPVGYLCWQTLSVSDLQDAGLADLPASLVDIDILIGEPEFLGRAIGPRALALLLETLRRDGTSVAGLGTSTDNHAAIQAFQKAGFRTFRAFEDPEYGSCVYLVASLEGRVVPPIASDGDSRCP